MPAGTLEVLLVGAKGIESTDFLCNMDPYAILICRTQEQKSSVASGKGTEPEWNENFVFTVSEGVSEMTIKLMDSDNLSSDDFVGEATIPLEPLFMQGSIPPTVYNVVKDQEYCGEIRVGLTFTPEERGEQRYGTDEQRYGTGEQRYGTGQQRYGTDEQRYGTDEHRYGTDEQRYGTDEHRYGTGEQRYGTDEQRYGTRECREEETSGGWKESS